MTKRTTVPIRVVHVNQPSHAALVRGAMVLLDQAERKHGEELRAQAEREAAEREKGAA